MDSVQRPNKAIIALIVIVLIAVVGTTAVAVNLSKKNTDTTTTTSTTETSQPQAADTTTSSPSSSDDKTSSSGAAYKDGTYSETGSYNTPGGRETITVSVTLSGDTVTATTATGSANGGESEEYQSAFISNYQSQVVGKKINTISLSRVSGSSLTSNGFNTALDAIKNDAKA